MKKTFFASYKKTTHRAFRKELENVGRSSLMNTLMKSVSGLFAVLDENREVLSMNTEMIKRFYLDPEELLGGLRMGDVFHCPYAESAPSGCGTSDHCRSCGLTIAIVLSKQIRRVQERYCVIETKEPHQTELSFKVKSVPFEDGGEFYFLLFLHEISNEQRLEYLDRSFFHTINNQLQILLSFSELSKRQDSKEAVFHSIRSIEETVYRLIQEVQNQSLLKNPDKSSVLHYREKCFVSDILSGIKSGLRKESSIDVARLILKDYDNLQLNCDRYILEKILIMMVRNAIEAGEGDVTLWVKVQKGLIRFYVHNQQMIPDVVAMRIFQKFYTTKKGPGRGFGTYLMRTLSRSYFEGTVYFTTSEQDGTVFVLGIPEEMLV